MLQTQQQFEFESKDIIKQQNKLVKNPSSRGNHIERIVKKDKQFTFTKNNSNSNQWVYPNNISYANQQAQFQNLFNYNVQFEDSTKESPIKLRNTGQQNSLVQQKYANNYEDRQQNVKSDFFILNESKSQIPKIKLQSDSIQKHSNTSPKKKPRQYNHKSLITPSYKNNKFIDHNQRIQLIDKNKKIIAQCTNNLYIDPLQTKKDEKLAKKIKNLKNKQKLMSTNQSNFDIQSQKDNYSLSQIKATLTQSKAFKSKEKTSPQKLKQVKTECKLKGQEEEQEEIDENQFFDGYEGPKSDASPDSDWNQSDVQSLDQSLDSTTGSSNNEQYTKQSNNNIQILNSIYEGRPGTVFIQYPPQCGLKRDEQRNKKITQFEEKAFNLKYKQIAQQKPYNCVKRAFEMNGFQETDGGDFNVCWGFTQKSIKSFCKYQKVNHFPGCWNLGRKDLLWRNLVKYKRKEPNEYNFIPNTFILSSAGDWDRFQTLKEMGGKKDLWIMKPANQACGRGIKLISRKTVVKKKKDYIIQEYLTNPHLINGYKYDLRLYVLVSSYDPLRIYLFPQGLARFATEKFNLNHKDITKRYIHLTNYSVNKCSQKYVKNQNQEQEDFGSKWSLQALIQKYKEMGINTDALFGRIKDLLIKTIIAAEPHMLDLTTKSQEHRNNCFELYGFDVIIDNNLKPWILEVNVSPSLSSSSPLDKKIKHCLLADTLNLIGIIPYDKKRVSDDKKKKSQGESLDVLKKKDIQSKNTKELEDLNINNCLQKLNGQDYNILFEVEEEFYRKGQFERIFPIKNKTNKYFQFFQYQRYSNILVDKWLSMPKNILESLLPKISNLSV